MGVADTITTTDDYQIVACPDTVRVSIQIHNASIVLGFGRGNPPYYDPWADETLAPMNATLQRRCNSVRIKSAITGLPALVFLKTLTQSD